MLNCIYKNYIQKYISLLLKTMKSNNSVQRLFYHSASDDSLNSHKWIITSIIHVHTYTNSSRPIVKHHKNVKFDTFWYFLQFICLYDLKYRTTAYAMRVIVEKSNDTISASRNFNVTERRKHGYR